MTVENTVPAGSVCNKAKLFDACNLWVELNTPLKKKICCLPDLKCFGARTYINGLLLARVKRSLLFL